MSNVQKNILVKDSFPINKINEAFNQKLLDDYLAFFTSYHGADMLPYAYDLESSQFYDELVKYNSDYYLFSDEVCIINQNTEKLAKYLDNITHIIEIGPGSHHAVKNKTLPILNCTKKLKYFSAIDISQNYLEDVINLVRISKSGLEIRAIEADFMNLGEANLNCKPGEQKCVLLLGSTIGNLTDIRQDHMLKQISLLIEPNDMIIFTVDTNFNEESLLKAYSSQQNQRFIAGILKHFALIVPDFAKYVSLFQVKCKWDRTLNLVDTYFVAKKTINFDFPGHGPILLFEGQELRGVKSRKSSKQEVTSLLCYNGFDILDIMTNSDKMQMYICRKTREKGVCLAG